MPEIVKYNDLSSGTSGYRRNPLCEVKVSDDAGRKPPGGAEIPQNYVWLYERGDARATA
jgi:hypothetical protein